MLRKFIFIIILFLPAGLPAQMLVIESYYDSLKKETIDSNKVKLMCDIAYELRVNDPAKAFSMANEALSLAKKIKFANGQSKSLGTLAIIFRLIGNYPLALEYNLQRLKLVEKTNDKERLASVLINIGLVYVNLEEYKNALAYYYKADSVIKQLTSVGNINFNAALNVGDVYDKLNMNDSAFSYFNKSLTIARELKNNDFEGMAMVGLGNSYLKTGQYLLALANYKSGIINLKEAENDDLLCEAYLGLAALFQKQNQKDSAVFYAYQSLSLAIKDNFLPRHLNAVKFLADHYKDQRNIDSSFYFLSDYQGLNDSINSKSRIREAQLLSNAEQQRQKEIAENMRLAKKERKQQLQMLFIAFFIPLFFVITLLLSRIRLHIRLIKISGVLSLLILFEYLTLLLHPYVKEITNHTPVYEMLIFVSIAAILIPTHHKVESRLIRWLTKNRSLYAGNKLKMKRTKIIKKTTEA